MAETFIRHSVVYREPGRFAGWPANYGIWSWGQEIVTGFFLGHMDLHGGFHKRTAERPMVPMQVRSRDGGVTWQVEEVPCRSPGGRGFSADEHMVEALRVATVLDAERDLRLCDGTADFTGPDFALLCGRTGLHGGAVSWFYLSADRCRTWDGPYRLPDFGLPGTAARTDYVVDGPAACTLFLTAAKSDGWEGRAFCSRTGDAGRTFRFLSWIGPEPAGYAIMPATVRLSGCSLLTAVRVKEPGADSRLDRYAIDLYRSDDDGVSWRFLARPVAANGGNPPAMIPLRDGRLCLVYGHRLPLYGIRARLSADEGETWGAEVILRDDGGDADLGYPRCVQRPDGKVVMVYYFDDAPDGERYIACTIWDPSNLT